MGRTASRLSECMKKHHPNWLNKRPIRNRQVLNTMHLIESDHQINTSEAFSSVYIVRRRLAMNVKRKILFSPKRSWCVRIIPLYAPRNNPYDQSMHPGHGHEIGLRNRCSSEIDTTLINTLLNLHYPCERIIPNTLSQYLLKVLYPASFEARKNLSGTVFSKALWFSRP